MEIDNVFKRLIVLGISAAIWSPMSASANGSVGTDFGLKSEKSLGAESNALFGVVMPLQESARARLHEKMASRQMILLLSRKGCMLKF